MSKTLPSGSVRVVHLVPYSSNSATLVAPRATARSTSAGRSAATRSRCIRFLPWRGSGTARNISAGKVRSSDAGIIAKNWLAPSVTGRSSKGRPEGGDLVSALRVDDDLAKSNSHGGVDSCGEWRTCGLGCSRASYGAVQSGACNSSCCQWPPRANDVERRRWRLLPKSANRGPGRSAGLRLRLGSDHSDAYGWSQMKTTETKLRPRGCSGWDVCSAHVSKISNVPARGLLLLGRLLGIRWGRRWI